MCVLAYIIGAKGTASWVTGVEVRRNLMIAVITHYLVTPGGTISTCIQTHSAPFFVQAQVDPSRITKLAPDQRRAQSHVGTPECRKMALPNAGRYGSTLFTQGELIRRLHSRPVIRWWRDWLIQI